MNKYPDVVYKIVRKIPKGKVATYGFICDAVNNEDPTLKINPKMVGWALHANKSSQVPRHRVVNIKGKLAANFAFDGIAEQRRRLEYEGIAFIDEIHVDLEKHVWKSR